MYLGQAYPTTKQANAGNTFQFAPSSAAILLTQASTVTNTRTGGYGFNTGNFADNLEVHYRKSCQGLM